MAPRGYYAQLYMFHFYPNVCYLLFRSLEIIIVTSSLQVIPLRMCRQGSSSTHQGKINGDLYSLSASTNKVAFSANKESADIWHARLGHPSARVLQQLQPHISLHHRLPPSTSPSPPPSFTRRPFPKTLPPLLRYLLTHTTIYPMPSSILYSATLLQDSSHDYSQRRWHPETDGSSLYPSSSLLMSPSFLQSFPLEPTCFTQTHKNHRWRGAMHEEFNALPSLKIKLGLYFLVLLP